MHSRNAYQFANKVMTEYNEKVATGTVMDYRQSKINTARRQLSKAYHSLKNYIGLADYSQLDAQISRVANLFPPSTYTDASVQAVVKAYNEGRRLDRDYDADSQKLVDNYYKRLYDAIEKLENVATIEFYNGGSTAFNQNIDYRYGYAIGFDDTFWNDTAMKPTAQSPSATISQVSLDTPETVISASRLPSTAREQAPSSRSLRIRTENTL